MVIKAINIGKELSKVTFLDGRTPESSQSDLTAAFTTLSSYDNGGVFTGRYSGESPWERHTSGDELVQIIEGRTELIILTEDDGVILDLHAGMLTVVPKGLWHRFKSSDGVSVLSVTPQPTEHSDKEDPRK